MKSFAKKLTLLAVFICLIGCAARAQGREWKSTYVEVKGKMTAEVVKQKIDEFLQNCKPSDIREVHGFIHGGYPASADYNVHVFARTGDGKTPLNLVTDTIRYQDHDKLKRDLAVSKMVILGCVTGSGGVITLYVIRAAVD